MNPSLLLDVQTLYRLMCLSDLVACVMLLACRTEAGHAELIRSFILGRLTHGGACFLFSWGHGLPTSVSVILPTSMTFVAYALEGGTMLRLRGLGPLPSAIPCAIGLTGIVTVHAYAWTLPHLVGLAGGFVSLICFFTSAAILAASDRTRLAGLIAAIFLLSGLGSLTRSYSGFFADASWSDRSFLQTSGLITAFAYCMAGGVGFLLLLREKADRALRREARSDPLTGLLNRRAFFEALGQGLARCEAGRSTLSLLSFDLDHFKSINDHHGHQVGDEALCQVSQVIAATLAARGVSSLPGRIGGEEFAAFVPFDAVDAMAIGEAVRLAVAGIRFPDMPGLACTVSIGVAEALPISDTLQSLVRRCDLALYEAKARGRNQVVLSNAQLTTRPTKGSSRNVWATSIP